MAKLYLVRHADAGQRSPGDSDVERRLSVRGDRQAAGLAELLGAEPISRVLASPFLRCQQTVTPLAARLGLAVEPEPRLAEATPVGTVLQLTEELAGVSAALCSHGDVIPDLLDALVQQGIRLKDDLRWQKCSTWVLSWDGGRLTRGRYLKPPG